MTAPVFGCDGAACIAGVPMPTHIDSDAGDCANSMPAQASRDSANKQRNGALGAFMCAA